jgi:hypothetical protein
LTVSASLRRARAAVSLSARDLLEAHLDVVAVLADHPRLAIGIVEAKQAGSRRRKVHELFHLGAIAPRNAGEQAAQELGEATVIVFAGSAVAGVARLHARASCAVAT